MCSSVSEITLLAEKSDRWVEEWRLEASPAWNVSLSGLQPVFNRTQSALVPVWQPWPGESAVLKLTQDEAALRSAFESSWRNKLSKAERSDLVLQKSGLKPAQYRWLLDAEIRQRQKRGYRAMPLELTERWQDAKADGANGDRGAGLAVFRADMGRDAAAGMLFLIHGSRATYHVGWTSDAGRENAAHNLILWAAMKELKAKGVKVRDLGGSRCGATATAAMMDDYRKREAAGTLDTSGGKIGAGGY